MTTFLTAIVYSFCPDFFFSPVFEKANKCVLKDFFPASMSLHWSEFFIIEKIMTKKFSQMKNFDQ